MKNLVRLSSLVAALCVGIPATGFTKDHGGSSHGGNFQGNSRGNFQGNHSTFQGTHGNWQASNHGNWQGGSHGDWHSGHGDWHSGHGDWHHHGDWRGHNRFYGSNFGFYGSYYPYYSTPYYGGDYYYDDYYSGPSVGFSITNSPSYRSGGDDLAIDVQRALRRDGYYRGSVDGDVGPGTRGAIRQYQYDHGLEVTGRIDRGLLRSLGLD